MAFTIAERVRAAQFASDRDRRVASPPDDAVQRAAVFAAEGVSSEQQCAYFKCDEQGLQQLHARIDAR